MIDMLLKNLILRIKQQLSNIEPSNLLIALSNWALKLSQVAYKKKVFMRA